MTATPKPLVLIILDGFGHSESPDYNAIYAAKKPVWDRLLATQPHGLISGSGMDVGLPDANPVNESIEAFVASLMSSDYGGLRPEERWLGNTDGDHAEGLRLADGSDALLEVLDPWDNPLVYIVFTDYDATFVTRVEDAIGAMEVDVAAMRNPLTGGFHQFESFQIRSAGPDAVFGTEDDIANFDIATDGE